MAKYIPQVAFILFLSLFILMAVLLETKHTGLAIRIIDKAFWLLFAAVLLIKVGYEEK